MNFTFTSTQQFTVINCGSCDVQFALSTDKYNKVVETGEFFYCPNGHRIRYTDNENSILKRDLDAQKFETERQRRYKEEEIQRNTEKQKELESTRHQLHGTQGALTKIKKRIGAGMCPVPGCKRHFTNLDHHLHTQHPDYKKACESQ